MIRIAWGSRAVRWMVAAIIALLALCVGSPQSFAQTTSTSTTLTSAQLDSLHRAQQAQLLASAANLQRILSDSRWRQLKIYRVATNGLCRKTDNWFQTTQRTASFARMRNDSVFYVRDPAYNDGSFHIPVGDTLTLTNLCIGPGQVAVAVTDTTAIPH